MNQNEANHYTCSTSEVANMYGLRITAVQNAINRGYLPARKSDNTWLVNLSDAIARWGKPKWCPPGLEQAVENVLKERGG